MSDRSLPVPREILAQHIAVLGKTRSGKSSVIRLLVEDLLGREQPVCVVDPKGDWWGVKLAADGKRPGYPVVIFGGEHADIPIDEHAGAHVAELFATGNRPCLIDLGGWMVGPRTRFWIAFASTLFRHTKGQRWLAVDEFHNFAPKGRVEDHDAGRMLHWSNRLASEGLGKGLGLIFASQRPQKVHNDSLTSAETLIAMRVLHPADRGAIAEWIKGCGDSEGSEVLSSLAQMERGEGWVWSPEIGFGPKRVKWPMFKTYDSFRPQSVEDTKRLKGWAEVDLDEVRKKMAATIEQAKKDDPKELRRQLAELRREMETERKARPAPATAPVVTKEKRVEIRALKDGQLARAETLMRRYEAATEKMAEIFDGYATGIARPFESAAKEIAAAIASTRQAPVNRVVPMGSPLTREAGRSRHSTPPVLRVSAREVSNPRATANGDLSRGQQKVLNSLAELRALGVDQPSRPQLALIAGYNLSGGSGAQHLADIVGLGLAEIPGAGVVSLTLAGQAVADPDETPTSLRELHERISAKLSAGQRKIFDHLIAIYPQVISRVDLGEAVSYNLSGGSGAQHLADLVTIGAARIPSSGKVAASNLLFPEGLD